MRFFSLALCLLMLVVSCGGSPPAPVAPQRATVPTGGGTTAATPAPTPAPAPSDPLEGWEKIRDEDGIVVHRKEVLGSPLLAFRGEGIIEAPIARVALVQMDLEHAPEWIERLTEARVLEMRSDTSFLTYSHLSAPPMVSDRDFVNEITIEFDPPRRIKFNLHSVDSPLGPVTPFVRAKLIHSSFELVAIDDKRTHLVCEIHADPKGSIPLFAVNFVQRAWAFKTISQLRVQTKRTDVVDRAPQIRALLAKHGFSI